MKTLDILVRELNLIEIKRDFNINLIEGENIKDKNLNILYNHFIKKVNNGYLLYSEPSKKSPFDRGTKDGICTIGYILKYLPNTKILRELQSLNCINGGKYDTTFICEECNKEVNIKNIKASSIEQLSIKLNYKCCCVDYIVG